MFWDTVIVVVAFAAGMLVGASAYATYMCEPDFED